MTDPLPAAHFDEIAEHVQHELELHQRLLDRLQLEHVQHEIERFGRLIVVELAKIRVDATAAEIGRAVDNAVRRFKFGDPRDVEGLEQQGPADA